MSRHHRMPTPLMYLRLPLLLLALAALAALLSGCAPGSR